MTIDLENLRRKNPFIYQYIILSRKASEMLNFSLLKPNAISNPGYCSQFYSTHEDFSLL